MNNDWIETTIGEYCPFVYGKGLPKTNRSNGVIPVYGSNGQVDIHGEAYVKTPGIIIGRKGSVGEIHLSKKSFWPIDTTFYVTKNDFNELRYTYYLLKSLGLDHMNSDSAVPGLNRENAHALKFKLPPEDARKNIGTFLGALDDKIELNKKINQTLEQIAQTIFKSWFVDFDPVHAKAKGQKPIGMDEETAALFPDSFEETELGLVPKGWKIKTLGDLFQLNYGKSLTEIVRKEGDIPVYGSGGIVGLHNEYLTGGPTIIIGRKGTVGSLYWDERTCYAIDTTFYVQSNKPQEMYWIYRTLKQINIKCRSLDLI